ncbi:hypothetical protein ANANG_G00020070 [Anguilla anguilla]|uniref:Uncharacterized protein n=1 Tax=Anguilla anguilla TaxID=7936 RepID=A0A9D3N168_ANGAN|nr:hypothetical protein ANANG_G00020070 [Anguilla anguilla]
MNLHEGETASMVTVKCFFGGRLADILLVGFLDRCHSYKYAGGISCFSSSSLSSDELSTAAKNPAQFIEGNWVRSQQCISATKRRKGDE